MVGTALDWRLIDAARKRFEEAQREKGRLEALKRALLDRLLHNP